MCVRRGSTIQFIFVYLEHVRYVMYVCQEGCYNPKLLFFGVLQSDFFLLFTKSSDPAESKERVE